MSAPAPAAPARPAVLDLPLLTHRGSRNTRTTETVHGVDGQPLATLALAPDLLVAQSLRALAGAAPPSAPERAALLSEAAERFLDDVLGGLSFTEHNAYVSRVSGHNAGLTEELGRAVALALAEAPSRADRARPVGSVRSWREVGRGGGSGVWTRSGETLAAVLSGNTPTIQNGWLQAFALGYRVVVRPSRREPFTAFRTLLALRAAGAPDHAAVYLPTGHAGVAPLLRRADLALVYGGDEVAARYRGAPDVKVAGPGRSKTLVTAGRATDPRTVARAADSVAALSGAACVNTTAILVEGDHRRFARDLAEVLRARAEGRQTTADHLGPRVSGEAAEALLDRLARVGARPVIPLGDVATPHPEGGVVLGPAVFTVDDPGDGLLAAELPFPCVWVAPWTPADGVRPLRGSLVVNAVTDDPAWVDALLHEPGVGNVHVDVPTVHGDGHLPHEGYLGDFLMRNRAVVRA
ncbi:aldehyde dehydrogenase family protein [Streptomyces sp. LE64]|uniref:aldehyde dehydrogenase family protein n=1 Tax=Streptomyces sp. LE64 TaxID=3448653 RepID=UPI0040417899